MIVNKTINHGGKKKEKRRQLVLHGGENPRWNLARRIDQR